MSFTFAGFQGLAIDQYHIAIWTSLRNAPVCALCISIKQKLHFPLCHAFSPDGFFIALNRLQQCIPAQYVMIVQIFVTQAQRRDALFQQVRQRVAHQMRCAWINLNRVIRMNASKIPGTQDLC